MQQPKRAEVTVYGEVQRVGYRYLIQNTARKFIKEKRKKITLFSSGIRYSKHTLIYVYVN